MGVLGARNDEIKGWGWPGFTLDIKLLFTVFVALLGGGSLGSLSLDGLLGESGGTTSDGTTTLTTLLGHISITTLTLAALTVATVGVVTVVRTVVGLTRGGNDDTRHTGETNGLEELVGLRVDDDLLGEILHDRVVRDDVLTALTLLLLELEGDSTDRSSSNTLHQVGGEASNLVTQTLGGDLSDLADDLLVGGEVDGELSVVLLDDHASGLLDGLSSDATLFIFKQHIILRQFYVLYQFSTPQYRSRGSKRIFSRQSN